MTALISYNTNANYKVFAYTVLFNVEGDRALPYYDDTINILSPPNGNPTIGVGININARTQLDNVLLLLPMLGVSLVSAYSSQLEAVLGTPPNGTTPVAAGVGAGITLNSTVSLETALDKIMAAAAGPRVSFAYRR